MGRNLRYWESDGIYFVTNRCAGGRYLLTPGPELNDAIEGLMARYATCHGVELLGWIFMGNYFHLIARSAKCRLSDFMRDFQSELSHRVQDLRDGWDESVFPNRFSDQPILDDTKLREKLLYVWMNPVRAGLVRHPDNWPGVSSVQLHETGEPREVQHLDGRKLRQLRRKADEPESVDPERAMQTYELEVTNPPALADRSVAEAGAELRADLEALCRHWTDMHRVEGESFAGADQVQAQDPLAQPDDQPDEPEPLCLASSKEKREAYRERYRSVVHDYRRAMEKWRRGDPDVVFPTGTHPPGWMRVADAGAFAGAPEDDGSSGSDDPRGDPEAVDPAA